MDLMSHPSFASLPRQLERLAAAARGGRDERAGGAMGPMQRLAAVAVVLAVLAIAGVDGWRSRVSISLSHTVEILGSITNAAVGGLLRGAGKSVLLELVMPGAVSHGEQ